VKQNFVMLFATNAFNTSRSRGGSSGQMFSNIDTEICQNS